MMNKEDLQEIEQILYYGTLGAKREKEAGELVKYIGLAFEKKLDKIPQKYRVFAQMMKHHWKNMQDISLEHQKKYLHTQVAGLWEHLKD
jgi:hypothetical protein